MNIMNLSSAELALRAVKVKKACQIIKGKDCLNLTITLHNLTLKHQSELWQTTF